ncbi:MAG: tetratricopeptide repeat protein [Litorimonas sp.]
MPVLKPIPSVMTLGVLLLLGGCAIAQPLTDAEQELKSDLSVSNYYPATREARNNIETQPLFSQAAFWGREYDLNPSDLESAIKLSASVRKLGNAQRAIEIAQTTRALYPRDPYLNAEFAAALIADERALDAIQPLDEALRIAPGYARLWSLKGAALDQTEQYDLARKHYQRALSITPHDPNILANLGLSHALSGDAVTAEKWLRRASASPNAGPGVHQNLALVLQLQGKTAEAAKVSHLSRGDQKLPAPPTPAHRPQSLQQSRPQSLSQSRPQSLPQRSHAPKAQSFPAAGQLTPEQQNVLNKISGSLSPTQVGQPQSFQSQPPQLQAPTYNGYPQQPALVPAQTQTQPQTQNYQEPRGAIRRRR